MAAIFSIGEIVKATNGVPAGAVDADTGRTIAGVSTDTRTLAAGQAFFALVGENHDAHDHLDEAASKGAALLVISDPGSVPAGFERTVLVVEDTLRAYQDLAAYYRKKVDPFVIAVTGSVGKTTAKDMIGCILSEYSRVYYTQGNLNNHIGLPRTILEMEEDTEILALEMGMSFKGEIERLCEIALPDVSVITNIGMSHRENFDSDDGILKAKFEITAFLGEGGTLVIDSGGNAELEKIALGDSRAKGYDLIRVASEGTDAAGTAEYVVSKTRISEDDVGVTLFDIREAADGETVPFEIPAPGAYVGVSAALASAAAARTRVKLADSAKALKNLKRTAHRLDPIKAGGVLVIDDTYNASPDSVRSGLEYLKNVSAQKRVAILADMNELGSDSEAMHRDAGAAAVLMGADGIYAYGEKAGWIADGAEEAARGKPLPKIGYYRPDEKEKLIQDLREEIAAGSAIYIKGSRTMKMEEVVDALTGMAKDTEGGNGAF